MPQLNHTDIQLRFEQLCLQIDPHIKPPEIGHTPTHDGFSHLEIDAAGYHWIATERGRELQRKSCQEVEELLYWLVDEVAWTRAVNFELTHRIPGQSFRRLLFAKHIEYLSRVSPAWGARKAAEIASLLEDHPFDDVVEG